MSNDLSLRRVEAVSANFNAAADIITFQAGTPMEVTRFGFVARDNAIQAALVLAIDKIDVNGVRTEEDTISLSAAVSQGNGVSRRVIRTVAASTGSDGSTVNVAPKGPVVLKAGEAIVLEVKTASGAAGNGVGFIEMIEHGFSGPDVSHVTEQN